MPIDLYDSLKGASQWAFGSPILNSILGSSIFVAIAIALLMILLIMFMYPAKAGTPFSVVIKIFIYMFFGTLLIVFLHDNVLKYITEEELSAKESGYFMQNTTINGRSADPSFSSMYKVVSPNAPPIQPNNTMPQQPNTPFIQSNNTVPVQPPISDTYIGGGQLGGIKPDKNFKRNPYS